MTRYNDSRKARTAWARTGKDAICLASEPVSKMVGLASLARNGSNAIYYSDRAIRGAARRTKNKITRKVNKLFRF